MLKGDLMTINSIDQPRKRWLFKGLGAYTCIFCKNKWAKYKPRKEAVFYCSICARSLTPTREEVGSVHTLLVRSLPLLVRRACCLDVKEAC